MLVVRIVVITVVVAGIMGDEPSLSDVMVKMAQMDRKIQNLEQQIEGMTLQIPVLFSWHKTQHRLMVSLAVSQNYATWVDKLSLILK